jgi:hypothetical protein
MCVIALQVMAKVKQESQLKVVCKSVDLILCSYQISGETSM